MLLALPFALTLAAIHLFGQRLRTFGVLPRPVWLSAAGGASVAYVFVDLLPELAAHQEAFGMEAWAGRHVYLLSLAGLTLFFGLDRWALRSRAEMPDNAPAPGVFWIHTGVFALYNAVIGYALLHEEERALGELALYTIAMSLHFLVNDHALRDLHNDLYRRVGRYVLAAAVLLGCALSLAIALPEGIVAAAFAVVAGGIVLNVLKEELPEEQQSRFWAFAVGVIGYGGLLLLAA